MLGAVAMLTLAADRAPVDTVAMRGEATLSARAPGALFISGHSLTDRPFPDHLAAIAKAAGQPLSWKMQHLAGSSLRDRAAGADGGAYDAQLLAERHTLLDELMLEDSAGQLATRAADKRTYLFASWLGVGDPRHPSRWIAYERIAGPAWRCTAALASDGRDPIQVVPAAEAMAWLANAAVGGVVDGITAGTPRATMRAIFTDDVHPTDAASFYVALVTYGILYGRLPRVPVPKGMAPETAESLRAVAAAFLVQRRSVPDGPAACRKYMADVFAPAYLAYVRDTRWRELGWARARMRWAHRRLIWPGRIRRNWGVGTVAA
jgi:hypothetical protein